MKTDVVEFIPGDITLNFVNLLIWARLLGSEDEPSKILSAEKAVVDKITAFTINEVKTDVGPGKYKSALFLLYLAKQVGEGQFTGTADWLRDGGDRELIEAYFPQEVVEDAMANSATKHTTVRDLLAKGFVTIKIERPTNWLKTEGSKK